MALSKEEVKSLAFLARINVPESELEEVSQNLTSIMDFVAQLNEADTKDIEPLTSICDMSLRQREDSVTDGGYADAIVANAPAKADNCFLVPKMME